MGMAPSVLSSQDLVGSLPSYSGPPPSPIATQSLPSFDEADESIVCIRSPKVCAVSAKQPCARSWLPVMPFQPSSTVPSGSYHISCSPATSPGVFGGTYCHDQTSAVQVGILRRGRYVKGKQIGKAPVVDVVRPFRHAFAHHLFR